MRFRILSDTSHSGLQQARKEILNAKNTEQRNRAALKLSEKMELASGFQSNGSLGYRNKARKLLAKLGGDVSNLKRDIGDMRTKRKKELGYPITPLAERRKERRRKDFAYDENALITSPEPTLSSPTKGRNLTSELQMLTSDDANWEEKRPSSRGKLVVRHTKKTMGLHRMHSKKKIGASAGKKTREKAVRKKEPLTSKNLNRLSNKQFVPPKLSMQERIDRDIKKAKNMFFMQKAESSRDRKQKVGHPARQGAKRPTSISSSGLRILPNNEETEGPKPTVPTLNTPALQHRREGGAAAGDTMDRQAGSAASTERTATTFRSSESSATSRGSSGRGRNRLLRDPADVCFSGRSYERTAVRPGMEFYMQYFRSSMSFAAFVENWKYIKMPATLVYSYEGGAPLWLWMYQAHDGMRRLEFTSSDEVRDFMAAFVAHLAPPVECQGEHPGEEGVPKALLSKRSKSDSNITVQPLFTAAQIQGAIFEILDCPQARTYATAYAVIQKFSKDALSLARQLQAPGAAVDQGQATGQPEEQKKKYAMRIVRAVWRQQKAIQFFSVKNKADVGSSAFTVEIEDFVGDGDAVLKDRVVVKKLIGRHLRLIEGPLTRMIHEMERTITKGTNRQLEDLVLDFIVEKSTRKGKSVSHDWVLHRVAAFSVQEKAGWRKLPELTAALDELDSSLPQLRASTAPNPGPRRSKPSFVKKNKHLEKMKRKLLPCDYSNARGRACALPAEPQRRPRTSVGAERKSSRKGGKKNCPGRFCSPQQIHGAPFLQMPYKLLALEHAASRLRPSKRWAVTETSVNVSDRYRLGDMAMVCKGCFHEYASRQIAREELRKSITIDVFKNVAFKKLPQGQNKKQKGKAQKRSMARDPKDGGFGGPSAPAADNDAEDTCLFCCQSVGKCEC